MVKIYFIASIGLFFTFFGFAQEKGDSVLSIRRSPFFTDIVKRDYPIPCLQAIGAHSYLRLNSEFLRTMPVEYLPTKKGLMLHFGRSGRLYQMKDNGDSLLYFERVDRTINQNYNNGSSLFYAQGDIYELSGYGFWKSNGLLRLYNSTDREWDIVPTNREVHVPLVASSRSTAWRDTAGNFLYVPYQIIINDGMSSSWNEATIDPVSYRLDIKTKEWEELGEMTNSALNLFKAANFICYPSENGYYLAMTKGVYFADFTSNTISFLEDPQLVQTLLRLQSNSQSYYYKGWVYSLNSSSYKYDSIRLDPKRFTSTGEVIWEKPRSFAIWFYGLFVLLMLGLFLLYRQRKRKTVNSVIPSSGTGGGQLQPFTETEQSLLKLLLGRSEKGLTANITDINYVLGLKDKSAGMQKKVRSDVMSNINEKYAFVTRQNDLLVQSIRSVADKRYFEYMINPACREKLRQLLS